MKLSFSFKVLIRRLGYVVVMLLASLVLHYYGYVTRSELAWTPLYAFIALIIGDELIVKHDRYLIRRRIKKEIIKSLKAQGYNPKDFDIDLDKLKIISGDDPEYDELQLNYKETDSDDKNKKL